MATEAIVEVAPTELGTAFGVTLVASTSTQLLAANVERERFSVSCDVADIFLWFGAGPAQLSKGLRIKSGGPPFMEESWKGAVQVISTGAATVYGEEQNLAVGDLQGEEPAGGATFVPSGPSDAYEANVKVTTGWTTGIKWPPNA